MCYSNNSNLNKNYNKNYRHKITKMAKAKIKMENKTIINLSDTKIALVIINN